MPLKKCLRCPELVDIGKAIPVPKGTIHYNDYAKNLGFCSGECLQRLPLNERKQIYWKNFFKRYFSEVDNLAKK